MMKSLSEIVRARVEFVLSHFPRPYAWVLNLKKNVSREKLLYVSMLRKGDVVIEGGANQGRYSVLFSHLVGAKGRVFSFEPILSTYASLMNNVRQYALMRNIECINLGLGATETNAEFHIPVADHQKSSLGGFPDSLPTRTEECRLISIDQFCWRNSIHKVDFVKLDVEGAEALAVQGGAQTLARCQPVIFFEFCPQHLARLGIDRQRIFRLLNDLGYIRFMNVDTGEIAEYSTAPWQRVADDHSVDFVTMVSRTGDKRRLHCVQQRLYRSGL